MRKIILLFAVIGMVPSASADWKEDIVKEMEGLAQKIIEKMGDDVPGQKTNFAYAMYTMMSGVCVGLAGSTQLPIPEQTIEKSVHILKVFMRGEIPSLEEISGVGLDCFVHVENTLVKQGVSKEYMEENIAPVFKKQLRSQIKAIFGNLPM